MAKNLRKPEYNLRDLLDLVKREVMLSLNCHALATIKSFDAEKQTVTAQILYKQAFEQRDPRTGKYGTVLVDYPVLIDCPVIIFGGGGGTLTFPIQAGDECVILFNDRDINNWFAGAANGDLESSRLHSTADGIALVGVRSLQNSLADYDEERAALSYRAGGVVQGKIGVKDKILIKNLTVDFKTQLDLLLTAINTAGTALGSANSFGQVNAAGTALALAAALVKVQMDLLFETEAP
jgi:hypothetical protein